MLKAPLYITVEQILNSAIGNEHTTLNSCKIDTAFFETYADDIKSLDVLTSTNPEVCKKTKEPANRLYIYIIAIENWLKSISDIDSYINNDSYVCSNILNLRANFENMSNSAESIRTIGVPSCKCGTVLKTIEDCLIQNWKKGLYTDDTYPNDNSLTSKTIAQLFGIFKYQYFNSAYCETKNDTTLNIYIPEISKSLVQLSDIQCQLYKFISFLKRLNKIQITLRLNKSKTTITQLYQYYQIGIPDSNGSASNYQYVIQANRNNRIDADIDTKYHHNETATAFPISIVQQDINEIPHSIQLDALIDINELHNINSLYTDDATGSNGTFSVNTNIIAKQKNTELDNIDFEQFGLTRNSLINKKLICSIIDKIFYTWYNHISIMDYTINICHCNCHINYVTFNQIYGSTSGEGKNYCCHTNSGIAKETKIIDENSYTKADL